MNQLPNDLDSWEVDEAVIIEGVRLGVKLLVEHVQTSRPEPLRRRPPLERGRAEAHKRLMQDYFIERPLYDQVTFRRRFRMSRQLFLRIVGDLEREFSYFQQKEDARNKLGFSPIQKCTSAIRQLAYGTSQDSWDEYLKMSEKASRDSIHNFCEGIIDIYAKRYLRSPSFSDIQKIYEVHQEVHGFSGMLGSIDCTHWNWASNPSQFIPETQPQPSPEQTQPTSSKRKHRKKGIEEVAIEKTIEKWTTDEELALAGAWLDTSEDPIIGDAQKGSKFWARVQNKFHIKMQRDLYRNPDQISGKWSAMRTKLTHFNNIYNRLSNNRSSGSSDVDIRDETHEIYKDEHKTAFTMVRVWELLRKSTKWHLVPPPKVRGSTKRAKTSSTNEANSPQGYSDVHSQINLNNVDDELDFDLPEEPVRPIGRDKAKAKAKDKAKSSSSTPTTINPEIISYIQSLDSKIDRLLGFRKEQQIDRDFEFLEKDLSNLPPEDRAIFERRKNEIRAKYRANE